MPALPDSLEQLLDGLTRETVTLFYLDTGFRLSPGSIEKFRQKAALAIATSRNLGALWSSDAEPELPEAWRDIRSTMKTTPGKPKK